MHAKHQPSFRGITVVVKKAIQKRRLKHVHQGLPIGDDCKRPLKQVDRQHRCKSQQVRWIECRDAMSNTSVYTPRHGLIGSLLWMFRPCQVMLMWTPRPHPPSPISYLSQVSPTSHLWNFLLSFSISGCLSFRMSF